MPFLKHLFIRKEAYRPTWKLLVGLIVVVPLTLVLTRNLWVRVIAQDLTCVKDVGKSGAMLVENFDPEYMLFQEAAKLQREGIASRVVVPVEISRGMKEPDAIETGIADLMARTAGLQAIELVSVHQVEPISLNAAREIRDFLKRENISSVQLIAPGFRSHRSALVYRSVFIPSGIEVKCLPVFVDPPLEWADSWHGIQDVVLQWGKLKYYQFWVLL